MFSVEPQFSMVDSVVQLVVKEPQKLDYEETQRMVVEVRRVQKAQTVTGTR